MTGFGKAEKQIGNNKYLMEIRSVNNRFCDIHLSCPKNLASREFEIKELIRKKITRGKIIINIFSEPENKTEITGFLSKEFLKNCIKTLKSLKKEAGIKEKIKIEHILSLKDLSNFNDTSVVEDDEFNLLIDTINSAIDDLISMKIKEGLYIQNDIMSRINIIKKENDCISELSRENILRKKDSFKRKLDIYLEDRSIIDEKRLEMELILLSDKLDITEECTRLKSHINYFKECIESIENAGKRLLFLLQEMNREVNTIASKSMDSEISQKITVLKEELEKIREQLQNVE